MWKMDRPLLPKVNLWVYIVESLRISKHTPRKTSPGMIFCHILILNQNLTSWCLKGVNWTLDPIIVIIQIFLLYFGWNTDLLPI